MWSFSVPCDCVYICLGMSTALRELGWFLHFGDGQHTIFPLSLYFSARNPDSSNFYKSKHIDLVID